MYDDPQSITSQRLAVVQDWIRYSVEALRPLAVT
jgi:hypothetical protein